jgi:hypothetical protein
MFIKIDDKVVIKPSVGVAWLRLMHIDPRMRNTVGKIIAVEPRPIPYHDMEGKKHKEVFCTVVFEGWDEGGVNLPIDWLEPIKQKIQ